MVGVLLAQTGLGKNSRWGTSALVIGANLPDIDVLWCTSSSDYLEYHRGITHAPFGIVLITLAATPLIAVGRRLFPAPIFEKVRIIPFSLLLLVGLTSHLLLDALNSYGVRPLLPFSPRWFHGDLLFIIDPWVWAGCLFFGVLLVTPATRRVFGLAAVLVLAATIGGVGYDRTSAWVPAAVAGIMLCGYLVRRARILTARSERVAVAGLVLLGGYLALVAGARS